MTSACAVCALEYTPVTDAHVHALVCAELAALARERDRLAATRRRERLVTLVAAAGDTLSPAALVSTMRALDELVAEHALVRALPPATCARVHALLLDELRRVGVRIDVPRPAVAVDDDDASSPRIVSRASLRSSAASTPATSPRTYAALARSATPSPRAGAPLERGASARESLAHALDATGSKSLATSPIRRPFDDDDDDADNTVARPLLAPSLSHPLLVPELAPSLSPSSSLASCSSNSSTRSAATSTTSPPSSTGSTPRRLRRQSAPPGSLGTSPQRSPSPRLADALDVALGHCECARTTASPRRRADASVPRHGRPRGRTYALAGRATPRAAYRCVVLALDDEADVQLATLEMHVDGEAYATTDVAGGDGASVVVVVDASVRPERDVAAAHRLWFRVRHVRALAFGPGQVRPGLVARLGHFTSLHVLVLSHTPALVLEDALFEALSALGWFVARYCTLERLPPRLGAAAALEYLDVSDNELVGLPASAAALERLRVLVVARNRLVRLPPVCAWPALEHLDAGSNELALDELAPAERVRLAALDYYSLVNNRAGSADAMPLVDCTHRRAAASQRQ